MTLGRQTCFAVYSIALLALNAGLLRALIDLSLRDATASHLIVVPFVAAGLIFMRRDEIFSTPGTRGWSLAFASVGAFLVWWGYLLRAGGRESEALSASIAGLVAWWICGFVLCYGTGAARRAVFPLAFLALMIPIPPAALDAAIYLLKSGSAEVVAALFALVGTPFHREDFTFSLPGAVILIADECSGIRSSIGLMLTGLFAGHIFLRTAWKKALLVLVMIPLTVIKNAIRIVTLVELAIHVNPEFLTGQLHHEGGVVFYLVALMLVAPLFTILQRSEQPLPKEMHS